MEREREGERERVGERVCVCKEGKERREGERWKDQWQTIHRNDSEPSQMA